MLWRKATMKGNNVPFYDIFICTRLMYVNYEHTFFRCSEQPQTQQASSLLTKRLTHFNFNEFNEFNNVDLLFSLLFRVYLRIMFHQLFEGKGKEEWN